MCEIRNVSQKKRVTTMIFFIAMAIVSLYFTKVYSDVKSTKFILTNEYQTYSE